MLLSSATAAHAVLVSADFNDIASGGINGKAGGTGWISTWTGSAGGSVTAGNLTTNLYGVTQGGTAQRYRSVNSTGLRQNYRTPTALSGEIWFSYLALAESTGDRAGVSINAPTASPFDNPGNVYAYLVGDTLNYSFGTGTAGTITGAVPVNTTALIVGKIVLNSTVGAADSITLWVNPDLTANPDINAYTPVYQNAGVDFLSAISTIGLVAARLDGAGVGGGDVDNVRFSDGGGNSRLAMNEVGVPEPTGMALIGGAVIGLAARRRRLA